MSQFQNSLISWISKTAGSDVSVIAETKPIDNTKTTVSVVLLDLCSAAPSHSNRPAPLSVTCKYLIFVHGSDSLAAQDVLENLLFSAMEHKALDDGTAFDVELNPPSPALWVSLQVSMRPCFWVSVIQHKPRDVKPAPVVTDGINFQVFPSVGFSGSVVSKKGMPLPGALVVCPSSNQSTMTDQQGKFSFKSLSPRNKQIEIVVSYKQYSMKSKVNITRSPVEVVFKHKEL